MPSTRKQHDAVIAHSWNESASSSGRETIYQNERRGTFNINTVYVAIDAGADINTNLELTTGDGNQRIFPDEGQIAGGMDYMAFPRDFDLPQGESIVAIWNTDSGGSRDFAVLLRGRVLE